MKQDETTLESVETVETNLKETIAYIEKNQLDFLCLFENLEKIANQRTELIIPNMQELVFGYLNTSSPRKEVVDTYNSILVLLITILEYKSQIFDLRQALDDEFNKNE